MMTMNGNKNNLSTFEYHQTITHGNRIVVVDNFLSSFKEINQHKIANAYLINVVEFLKDSERKLGHFQ